MEKPMRLLQGEGVPATRVSTGAKARLDKACDRLGITLYRALSYIIEDWAIKDAAKERDTGVGIDLTTLEGASVMPLLEPKPKRGAKKRA